MLRILVLWGLVSLSLCGCGGSPNCDLPDVVSVSPASATADHGAEAPGGRQRFMETSAPNTTVPGCPVPAHILLLQPNWTVSDPLHVSISSAKDDTNGLAICLGATQGAATIVAVGTGTVPSRTATLTCK